MINRVLCLCLEHYVEKKRRRSSNLVTTLAALFIGLAAISLVSCESDSSAYKRGWSDGYQAGVEYERVHAYQDGYQAGFEAARPSNTTTQPAGVFRIIYIVVTILGMVKIVVWLLIFISVLIHDSKEKSERMAKIIAIPLATLVVIWLSNISTAGFSEQLRDIALVPTPTIFGFKLLIGLAAAAGMWAGLCMVEFAFLLSEDSATIGTFFVFIASAVISIFVPFFVSLFSAPNINAYLFFDLIFGVLIGGAFWLVRRLLDKSRPIFRGSIGRLLRSEVSTQKNSEM